MSPVDEALARPEFELVDLTVDVDEAHRTIEETVKGLSTAETEAGVKYRTRDGMLVAIVGSRPSDDGEGTARLAYRAAPASEPATRKASKILEALEPNAADR